MSLEIERRSVGDLGAAGRTVQGYAILFGQPADLGDFTEVIEPSAVDRTLSEDIDVRALLDHSDSTLRVLGRRSAGTLRMEKDARGLRVAIDIPKTAAGDDILALVERRDVTGMSFSFGVVRPGGERWEQRNGKPWRTLTDLRIPEVSVVAFPAYPSTSIAKRSLEAFMASPQGQRISWLRMRLTA
jgi:uncharacterized protein